MAVKAGVDSVEVDGDAAHGRSPRQTQLGPARYPYTPLKRGVPLSNPTFAATPGSPPVLMIGKRCRSQLGGGRAPSDPTRNSPPG